jgi:DNA-binding LytR/AlgR family response regulator
MPVINGLEVAKRLRKRYPELIIIFVTAYIDYAPAGYRVDAFRYLLKNHIREELDYVIDEVQQKLFGNKAAILIHQKEQESTVALSNILYFEGTPRRMVLLHLKNSNEAVECNGKLSDYEEELSEKGFLRLQKSFLVNMMHIKKINNYQAILIDGSMLKVSEKNYSQICDTYLQWKGQQI